MLRILTIGKKNSLFWVENLNDAILSKGYHLNSIFVNDLGFIQDCQKYLLKKLSKKYMSQYLQKLIEKSIKKFNPDIILVISPFHLDSSLIESLSQYNTTKIAWVGDIFGDEHKQRSDVFDKLFVTDSYFCELANNYSFPNTHYLPLAVNENVFIDKNYSREDHILFIGSYTQNRFNLINQIKNTQVKLIGPKWQGTLKENVMYNSKKIGINDVVYEYNKAKYILNIKHEHNVVNGLNMRTFEAIASGSCLLQDYVKDIELNFQIGEDILAYKNIDELDDLIQKLQSDKDYYKMITSTGRKTVLHEHTYVNRLEKILNSL